VDSNGLPKKILTVIVLAGFLLGGGAILCAKHRPPLAFGAQDRTGVADR